MTRERIQEILNAIGTKADLEKALDAGTEATAAALEAKGFQTTAAELDQMIDELLKMSEEESGELGEDDLEDVAGGIGLFTACLIGAAIGTVAYWAKQKKKR